MATTSSSSYTPINATSAAGVNYEKYLEELKKQQQYIAANPSAGQAYTQAEKQEKYGGITDPVWNTGVYTSDKEGALAAGQQWGIEVTPTSYNGKDGYYYVPDVKDQRTVQEGSSGADEGLMNNQDYAIVQSLKQDYATAQQNYNAAVAAGDTALATQYQQEMDNAHLEAERIRTGYGYSGGADGSMHITYGALGVGGSGSGSGYGSGGYGSGYGSSGGYGGGLTGMVEDYSAYLEQMYAVQKAAALAQLDAAYQSNLAALDRAEAGIGEQYQTARNNTAGASELAKRNFAEYAAANGLNNGTGGQAELGRSVTLQNNLNSINTAEADTVSDLQLQRSNAEIEYNNAIAQAQAQGDYELAAALYQEKVRVQNALIDLEIQQQKFALQQYQLEYQAQRDSVSDSQWQQQFAFQQQKYADSLTQNQQSALAEYGNAYLQNGIMPSAEMLAAMGITQADAQAYLSALQARQAAGTASGSPGSSGGSTGSSGGTMTLTTAKQAASAGVFNDQVLSVLRSNGYTDDMLEAIYGYAGQSGQAQAGDGGYNYALFTAAMRSVAAGLAQGNEASVFPALDSLWGKLSQAQKQTAQELLAKYGYHYTEG